jgi:hypothetical protein
MTKTGGWASHTLLPAADLIAVPAGVDPLTDVREAMELAESHTAYGKVVLIPRAGPPSTPTVVESPGSQSNWPHDLAVVR